MKYGEASGTFTLVKGDGTDANSDLDVSGDCGLTVTFTPSIGRVRVGNTLVSVSSVKCSINADGALVGENGLSPVRLFATDVGNPTDWHWTAVFNRPSWESVDFTLPAGQAVDLAALVPGDVPAGTLRVTDEATAARANAALEKAETLLAEHTALTETVGALTGRIDALENTSTANTGGTPDAAWVKELLKALDGPNQRDLAQFEGADNGRILIFVRGGKAFTTVEHGSMPGSNLLWRLRKGAGAVHDATTNAALSVPDSPDAWVALAENNGVDEVLLDADDWPAFGYLWVTPADARENLQSGVAVTLGAAESVQAEQSWDGEEWEVTVTHSPELPVEVGGGRIDLDYPLEMSARKQYSLPAGFNVSWLNHKVEGGKLVTTLGVTAQPDHVERLRDPAVWTLDVDSCVVEF